MKTLAEVVASVHDTGQQRKDDGPLALSVFAQCHTEVLKQNKVILKGFADPCKRHEVVVTYSTTRSPSVQQ